MTYQDEHDDGKPIEMRARDLERRVTELEQQVVTLTAAVDAASRMRVAAPYRLDQKTGIAGGQLVRRILERGRLIEGYRDTTPQTVREMTEG